MPYPFLSGCANTHPVSLIVPWPSPFSNKKIPAGLLFKRTCRGIFHVSFLLFLFVAQGFDWVHSGCLVGRIVSEENTDHHGEYNGSDHGCYRCCSRITKNRSCYRAQDQPQDDPQDTANETQDHGFYNKLQTDGTVFGT